MTDLFDSAGLPSVFSFTSFTTTPTILTIAPSCALQRRSRPIKSGRRWCD